MVYFIDKLMGFLDDFQDNSRILSAKIPGLIHICVLILTTPWECLRKPITHLLHIGPNESQRKIELWCDNKKTEYRYVAMSGTVVASAVTASFSWDVLQKGSNWFTLGTWYGSIVLSLVSVIIAFHHIILFANFGIDPEGPQKVRRVLSSGMDIESGNVDMVFLYVLQVPGMLLSFSLMSYFMGLSMLVFLPLLNHQWDMDAKSAVVYLVYLVFGGLNYFFVCSVVYSRCLPAVVQ